MYVKKTTYFTVAETGSYLANPLPAWEKKDEEREERKVAISAVLAERGGGQGYGGAYYNDNKKDGSS